MCVFINITWLPLLFVGNNSPRNKGVQTGVGKIRVAKGGKGKVATLVPYLKKMIVSYQNRCPFLIIAS